MLLSEGLIDLSDEIGMEIGKAIEDNVRCFAGIAGEAEHIPDGEGESDKNVYLYL